MAACYCTGNCWKYGSCGGEKKEVNIQSSGTSNLPLKDNIKFPMWPDITSPNYIIEEHSKYPYKCPVCEGRTLMPEYFYNDKENDKKDVWISCKSCEGKGYIVI